MNGHRWKDQFLRRSLIYAVTILAVFSSCTRRLAPTASGTITARPATSPVSTSASTIEALDRLWRFQLQVEQNSLGDEAIRKMMNDLSRAIPDQELSTVERFAKMKEAKSVAWPLARLLVERGHFDGAANVIVDALLDEPANREYRMWKWWEASFIERPD